MEATKKIKSNDKSTEKWQLLTEILKKMLDTNTPDSKSFEKDFWFFLIPIKMSLG